MNVEDITKGTPITPEMAESSSMPLASEQANINFQSFLTGLSDEEKETKLNEQFLQTNFRLKELHSTLELNAVKNIYNTIVQKNRQMTDKKMKKNWTDDETSLLLWIVRVISKSSNQDPVEFTESTWNRIANMIPYKACENCKLRWLYLKKNSVQCTPWTDEEDNKLKEIILNKGANSNKWNEIAKELYNCSTSKTFRKGKQCRERWNNHLDPDMKRGQWTDGEDLQLLQLSYGNGNKWSFIAKQLKERTENAVKNRYKSLLRKEEKENKQNQIQSGLSQTSIQVFSCPQNEISSCMTNFAFIEQLRILPTTPEQLKIFNIIIKLMNKISSEICNPQQQKELNTSSEERIEEEDIEDDCDDQQGENDNEEEEEEEDDEEEDNQSPQSNTQIIKNKRKQQRKRERQQCDDKKRRNEMQIEGKNDNTPTATNTDCNTTDLNMSDNKAVTQSTIFTPSNSPFKAQSTHSLCTHKNNEEQKQQSGTFQSIFCQKNAENQDEAVTTNNIGSSQSITKPKRVAKQGGGRKKKINQSNQNDENITETSKQGGVSTFSDALLLQPLSLSRSSSPYLVNGLQDALQQQSNLNAKKKKKQEKNDTASLTTASTITNRESSLFNPRKIQQGFMHRTSIQSCNTPLGQASMLNPYYSHNAAPSPCTQLIGQFNNLHIKSTENTPSSAKRRHTFTATDFQSALNIESLYKIRNYFPKQAEEDDECSQEQDGRILTGNKNYMNGDSGTNIRTIDESEEGNHPDHNDDHKKMEIEQESNSSQQMMNNFIQHTPNNLSLYQDKSCNQDDNTNNENCNNLNILKKEQYPSLKFVSNNSAFKQFSSSPLQSSIIRPKNSSLQLLQSTFSSGIGSTPIGNSPQVSDQNINSPLNSPLLLSQLSQCMEQQQSILTQNYDFSTLLKLSNSSLTNSNNKTSVNNNQQLPQIPKSEPSKGFQMNKNFKSQPSLFQPINPSLIFVNNQQ